MLESPLTGGKSGFITTTALLLFSGWIAIKGVLEAARGRRDFAPLLAASTSLLIVAVAEKLGGHSPDAAGAVVGFAALVAWAQAFDPDRDFRRHFAAASLLSLLAFTIKASYVVLPAASAMILAVQWRRLERRATVSTGAIAGALLVPWVANGILVSGCLLFPATAACLPVSWATPASIANDLRSWIMSWARWPGRTPSEVLGRWDWLPVWSEMTLRMETIQALVAILGASALALALMARHHRLSRAALIVWGASMAGVLFWFAMAPTPRFGWAYLFGAALAPAVEASATLLRRWPNRAFATLMLTTAVLSAVWIQFDSLRWLRLVPASGFSFIAWPEIPAAPTYERETLAGYRVRLPLAGDQCWDAPLPCTPFFDPGLSDSGAMRTTTVNPVHP
jgi:hypothetical protein